MSTLELFQFPDQKGKSIVVHKDSTDLILNSNQKIQSLRVCGEPWIVFTRKNYDGAFYVFHEGIHSTIPSVLKKICSLRIIKGGLHNPKITIYENVDYKGQDHALEEAEGSMKSYGMENGISSHKVENGAWLLYEGEYYTGKWMIALAGDEVANYCTKGWLKPVSSLKPILDYQTAN